MRKYLLFMVWFPVLAMVMLTPAEAVEYHARYLNTQPEWLYTGADGINDRGQVVGHAQDASYEQYGVFWDTDGSVVDIGGLGGDQTWTSAINNRGQVVGVSRVSAGGPYHAFLWSLDGGMTDLGTLEGATESFAYGINDVGQVVGSAHFGSYQYAVLWDVDGSIRNLGLLPGGTVSVAFDINESGQVVGNGDNRPVFWDVDGNIREFDILAGDNAGVAFGINEAGIVVGQSTFSSLLGGRRRYRPVLWDSSGGITMLVDSNERAVDINDFGQVLGSGGVIWNPDGTTINLAQFSEYPLSNTTGINNLGQVAGWSVTESYGDPFPVVWEPVPEPTSISALLAGIGVFAGLGMRRRRKITG